jgi:hypothetical protein
MKYRRAVTAGLLALGLVAGAAWPREAPSGIETPRRSQPADGSALGLDRLGAALKAGGYVIFVRHVPVDIDTEGRRPRQWPACEVPERLDEVGRTQAYAAGLAISRLGLDRTLAHVLAAPTCRTLEMASLMVGTATPTTDLGHWPEALKRLLAQPVAPGQLRWLFGHADTFRLAAGPPHLAPGEAVVVQPTGRGWIVVARVPLTEWPLLLNRP